MTKPNPTLGRVRGEAKAIPKEDRKRILTKMPETEMHGHLAELYRAIQSDYWVEVTHGPEEYGKDLVIVRDDRLSPDVIGVVVKRGDIKGKTARDVDALNSRVQEVLGAGEERITSEILSQIKQARNHDAVLKNFSKKLRVNKVFVVLVGEISKNARERIEKELSAGSQIFDLAWVVDNFTEHYPQVFFQGRAISYLEQRIQDLEKDSFYGKSGKTLSECFVDPFVSPLDIPIMFDDSTHSITARRKRFRLSQFRDAIRANDQVVIVGDPGSGKSKALAKLCIDRYSEVLHQLLKTRKSRPVVAIPLLVAARSLLEAGSDKTLGEAVLPEEVREFFEIEMILVDGIDEVAGARREDVLTMAIGLAASAHAKLVLTSRKIAMFDSPPKGFERFELLPFEFGHAMKLIEKLITNASMLPAVKNGLERIQSQIPLSPLSLLLLVELVNENKEIPSSITELYDRFLDMVLGRWDKEKGLEILFEYIVKKRFLSSLAYNEFLSKNRLEIPKGDYETFFQNYANEYGWAGVDLSEFAREIERAGILTISEDVFFRHRSFLDYFVGAYYFDKRGELPDMTTIVRDHYFGGFWSEVAFFFVGLGREIRPELVAAIFDYPDTSMSATVDKFLVGRLVQAGWHTPAKIKIDAIEKSIAHAIEVREKFLQQAESFGIPVAKIFGDMLVMMLAETSFGSGFLAKETEKVLENLQLTDEIDESTLFQRLALLWARKRQGIEVEDSEVQELLDSADRASLQPVAQARLLILAGILRTGDGKLRNILKRRMKRLQRKAPKVFQGLLPSPNRGQKFPRRLAGRKK